MLLCLSTLSKWGNEIVELRKNEKLKSFIYIASTGDFKLFSMSNTIIFRKLLIWLKVAFPKDDSKHPLYCQAKSVALGK